MTADPGRQAGLRIGVVFEAFPDWPLEQVMSWLRRAAPEVTDVETGAGGSAPHPRCDVVVSIEHQDPVVPATPGVPDAARLLRAAIDAALEPA